MGSRHEPVMDQASAAALHSGGVGGVPAALATQVARAWSALMPSATTPVFAGSHSAMVADSSGHASNEAGVNEEFERLSLGVLFTTMLIFLGGTFFMTHKSRIPLPYTVILFLYGILVGAVAKWVAPDVASALGQIPPELLFYIFLPVLIFEGSFAMNVHALRRVFFQTLILATVGILINTVILGCAVKMVYSSWSWYTAMLLGSLLSATDPVAVVSLLKGLRVDKHVTAMVDGEAVMNDGTAIIAFTLLLPAAKKGSLADPVWLMVLNCFRLSVLPVILGPAFGFIQSFWLRRAKDGLTRACVTVSVTYVSYYVAAHWVGASGVLTLFFQGVFLSYYCPSLFPGVEGGNLISSTWEFLVHIGNTMLFSLVGVILVADVVPTIEPIDVVIILVLYVAMIIARLVMLEVLLPVLNLFSYKMDQRKVLLLVHAGLRGGVAATLALAVQQDGVREGIPILKVTCGVVLLTLIVNATSAARVVDLLGFRSKEAFRVEQVQHAMDYLYDTEEKALERVKRDTKYRNANWLAVEKYVSHWLRNPFAGMEILPDDEDATINRLLMTSFKNSLWRQRDEQVVSETVVGQLGQIIADKIEKGELFYISEMNLYHREGGRVRPTEARELHKGPIASSPCNPRRTGAGAATATEVTVEVSSPLPVDDGGTSSTGSRGLPSPPLSAVAARGERAPRSSPRTHAIVVDVNRTAAEARRREAEMDLMESEDLGGALVRRAAAPAAAVLSLSRAPPLDEGLTAAGVRVERSVVESADARGLRPHTPTPTPAPAPAHVSRDVEEDTDAVVEALMSRLLPAWVVLAERFVCGRGYFVSAHHRAQENAFMTLLAVVKCLTALAEVKYLYVRTPAQAHRVEVWFSRQLADGNAAIRFFYNHFPEATNTVASTRAVISVLNELHSAIEELRKNHGVGARVAELLETMTEDMRENIPTKWVDDMPTQESELVTQAVAATTLGKGLRKGEIRAIATMGLVKRFVEDDIITLPDNAFLIVVFGSLRALHSRWTTISEHAWTESFGDTVGLETLLLPAELCKDRQRQWTVISTEATALLISFNSIKPFLSERSLRSVKALWRAAAGEVVLPFLETMVFPTTTRSDKVREHLMGLVAAGTPLIGPEECANFDHSTQYHLLFYLRGSDVSGLFNGHTPPCYISALYASQLRWRDPEVVLYAVPMNISDAGYVPWNLHTGGAQTGEGADRDRDRDSFPPSYPLSEGVVGVRQGSRPHSPLRSPGGHAGAAAGGTTFADAALLLHNILRGIAPGDLAPPRLTSASGEFGSTNSDLSHARAGGFGTHGVEEDEPSLLSELYRPSSILLSRRLPSGSLHPASLPEYAGVDPATLRSVCILQRLTEFVTPVPYVNQLFAQYATHLELLCIAALRYTRDPGDAHHARNAILTADGALKFLLSFGVELALLRRAIRAVAQGQGPRAAAADTDSEDSEARLADSGLGDLRILDGAGDGEVVDAAFQCKVCAWSRQAAATKKHHLKTLIMEMNAFANARVGRYVATLKEAVRWQPKLSTVESVEGLQMLLQSIARSA